MIGALLLLLAAPEPALAIVGGEIHPVNGPVIPRGTVLIRGDRIVELGPAVKVPPGATVIEAQGRWVTPGLVEGDSELGVVEVDAIRGTNDAGVGSPDPIRAAARMTDAVDLGSALIGVARRHGITSAVAVPYGGLIAGQSAWFDLVDPGSPHAKDAVRGPAAVHAILGEVGASVAGGSRAMAMLKLREVLEDARVYAKDKGAFERNALRRLVTSRLDLEALQEVLARRVRLVLRVHRASDILAALRFAEEEKITIALLEADEGWMVASEIAKAGVPVLVNAFQNLPASFERRGARSDNAALMAKAGVKVGLTTESAHNASSLRFLAGNAVRAGLPAELALRAVTLVPAEIYGQAKRSGSLEPGKQANLVVWTGDPFEPSSWAEVVIIAGLEQPLENRQTRLRDRYKARLGL
jgi:imidazolonepropionase-like amidohydrolase